MNAPTSTISDAPRTAEIRRTTRETNITCTLTLDGSGEADIATGIGFLDHMLDTIARHAGFDLALRCEGDLHIDDHHTAEDCAIVLGQALDSALGDRAGVARFADACAPLDEALARAVIDLVTRPVAVVHLALDRERIGAIACENIPHFFRTFAVNARMTLHLDTMRGENDHHKAEAACKALALALRAAVARTGDARPRSTKGAL